MTQTDLARATGVSRSAVAQWETGRASFAVKLTRIAAALDVPLSMVRPRAEPEQVAPGCDEDQLLAMFRAVSNGERACILFLLGRLCGHRPRSFTLRSEPRAHRGRTRLVGRIDEVERLGNGTDDRG